MSTWRRRNFKGLCDISMFYSFYVINYDVYSSLFVIFRVVLQVFIACCVSQQLAFSFTCFLSSNGSSSSLPDW